MTKTILIAGSLLAIALLLIPQSVSANQDNNSDVSVWDSGVTPDVFAGIFPIGGAGQIAGNFAVDTITKKDTAIQVGLRAQERFAGPIEPIKDVYFAPTGESTPGLATWNFDWSLDSGTTYLESQLGKDLTAQNLEDYDVVLTITDSEDNSFALDFGDFPNPAGPIVLSQSSQNIGFGYIGLPIDSQFYEVSLSVSDGKKTVAESEITVIVTDEVPENGKVDLCHKSKTISVAVESLKAHHAHGDKVGHCGAVVPPGGF